MSVISIIVTYIWSHTFDGCTLVTSDAKFKSSSGISCVCISIIKFKVQIQVQSQVNIPEVLVWH